MKKIYIIIIIILLTIFVLFSLKQEEDETIKIGALLCLSGGCAEWGENSLNGAKLAIKEINNNGGLLGKQIELIVQDGEEDTISSTISAYRALLLQSPDYIIGPNWSAAGQALHPIASKENVIITSPSLGIADFNEGGDNIFNTWSHDDISSRALARLAIEKGQTHFAILSSKQPWEQEQGLAIKDEVEKLGGTVVFYDEPHENTRDFRTIAIKIKNSNPNVVIFTNHTHMGIAAKDIRNAGYEGLQMSILMDETRVEIAQGALDQTIYAQSPEALDSFVNKFMEMHGEKPGITSDTAYDAVMLYAQAVNRAETTDFMKVKDEMNKIKEFKSATGPVTLDVFGAIVKDPVFWQVDGGEFIRYKK